MFMQITFTHVRCLWLCAGCGKKKEKNKAKAVLEYTTRLRMEPATQERWTELFCNHNKFKRKGRKTIWKCHTDFKKRFKMEAISGHTLNSEWYCQKKKKEKKKVLNEGKHTGIVYTDSLKVFDIHLGWSVFVIQHSKAS